MITEKQAIEILKEAKIICGRTYKSKIRSAWETGRYADYGLQNCYLLQSIRNQFGPSWLSKVKIK